MTTLSEKNTAANDIKNDIENDDNWEPISIPVEDDPTITAADLERFQQIEERITQGHCITLSFKQLYGIMEAMANK